MRSRSRTLPALLSATVLFGGCAAATSNPTGAEPESRGDVRFEGGGFVLDGRALEDGPGTIIATLMGKVPNFRVQRNTQNCPIVTLRNAVSFQGVVNPHVYVDGTRTTDTCVLTSLRTLDVERVEVYPQGVTQRPGYGTHAHGLILVFMRSARL